MLYARVPMERIGVLIGKEGETKERIEKLTGVKIVVDSKTGEVTIDESEAKNPVDALKVKDIVTAIVRGFSEGRAMRLLNEDTYLELIEMKDYVGESKSRLMQVKGRIIGAKGKTRRIIEELTGADISVYGHTVGIIGDSLQVKIAGKAVDMILTGSEHATVYRFLERKRDEIKMAEMGFG